MCLLQGPLPACRPGLDAAALLQPTPPVLLLAAQVRQASNLAIGPRPAGQLQDGPSLGRRFSAILTECRTLFLLDVVISLGSLPAPGEEAGS